MISANGVSLQYGGRTLFNDVNVRDYGSQGQQRLSVLYMKFAELELIKNKKGESVVSIHT